MMSTTNDPFGTVVTPDIWVMQLTRRLGTPGLPASAVVNLRRCDRTFDLLDHALRNGSPLPLVWETVDGTCTGDDAADVTDAYDRLSSALRTVGGVPESFAALRVAVRAWARLDGTLRAGGALPEPWRR